MHKNPSAFDWIEVAEIAVRPRSALPTSPLEWRAWQLRRELLARVDAQQALRTLEAVVLGAKTERSRQRQAALDASIAKSQNRAKKREEVLVSYKAWMVARGAGRGRRIHGQKGRDQKDFANAQGISHSTLRSWLRGSACR